MKYISLTERKSISTLDNHSLQSQIAHELYNWIRRLLKPSTEKQ